MSKKEEEEFKVIDRRHSAKGENFTMKEAKSSEPAPEKIDFSTLVYSFATGALISMGLAPDPATKKTVKNLEMARQNIDILTMLKEKTKGNLFEDEDKLLENLLTEVRLRFVEASR